MEIKAAKLVGAMAVPRKILSVGEKTPNTSQEISKDG